MFGVLPPRRSTRSWRRRSAATASRLAGRPGARHRRRSPAQIADGQRLEPRPLSEGSRSSISSTTCASFALRDALDASCRRAGACEWAIEEAAPRRSDPLRADPAQLYMRVPGNARMNRRELGKSARTGGCAIRWRASATSRSSTSVPTTCWPGSSPCGPRSVDDLDAAPAARCGDAQAARRRILDAVARGEALPEDELPQRASRPLPPGREAFVATLAVLLGALAAENDLPPALLLPRAALERIARELPPRRADLHRRPRPHAVAARSRRPAAVVACHRAQRAARCGLRARSAARDLRRIAPGYAIDESG